MGRQLSDEPFRQRLEAVVFLGFGLSLRGTAGADCDDAAVGRAARLTVGRSLLISRLDRLYRRLVLGTDIAALDAQTAVAINADKPAGARDLRGLRNDAPVLGPRPPGVGPPQPPAAPARAPPP